MKQYRELVEHILTHGETRVDRTGVGTKGVFGYQMRFNLSEGFPIVTGKFTPFKTMCTELIWFLRGETNVKWLQDRNCHIWDEWVKEDGTIGDGYGKQWRNWTSAKKQDDGTYLDIKVDQIKQLVEDIKKNPYSRRHIVSAWNPVDVPNMALPPCHTMFQFFVSNENKLSCQLYQRSGDVFLGVSLNIASYALLTHMIAHLCDLEVGDFVWTGGDCHLYTNHFEQANEYLSRPTFKLPKLVINKKHLSIDDFDVDSFSLDGYEYGAQIKAQVAV